MTVDSSNVPRKPNTVISHEDFHGGKIQVEGKILEPIIGFLKSQTDCQSQSGFYIKNANLLATKGTCLLHHNMRTGQCYGFMKFLCGSGSGSADPYL
jgi:hypothetical protein